VIAGADPRSPGAFSLATQTVLWTLRDRRQRAILVGLCVLLAAPIARQGMTDNQLAGLPMFALLWLAAGAACFPGLVLLRLAFSLGVAGLQRQERFLKYWSLLKALTYRDLRARYARSSLSWSWILIQPLFQMAVFTALRAVLGITESGNMNFVIFLYTAILPWNFIVTAVNTSGPAVFANGPLIKKMPISREIFVLSALMAALVDFFMGQIVLVAMMTYFAVPITWNLLWYPVLVLVAILLGLGVGLLVAAIAPFRGDVTLAIPYVMQLWMFMTPIFYSTEGMAPELRGILSFNPTVGLITGFRNVMGAGAAPDLLPLAWSAAFAVLLLALAWPFFRHMSQFFADMM